MEQDRSRTPDSSDGTPAESQLRFRTLFEQAPFSVQLLAADGRTLRVNRAWEALWGVTEGDGLLDFVLSEYNILRDPQLEAKGVTPYLRRAFAGETVAIPAVLYDPAELGQPGRARWVLAHAHPIRDAQGALQEVMLIHEDVTERVRAENDLRASEMRLKQLANTIPQLAWMADPLGDIHWYNDRWYDYTGTTPPEMLGWGWQAVHDPQVLPRVMQEWKQSLASGTPFQMTFPLRGRDGRFRPFLTLVAPLKDADGRVVQWFGTNTDVSALQEADRELRWAEERLRLSTEAGNIGIWDWDIASGRVDWSDRVYPLYDLAPGRFGGRLEDFTALVHPDDLPGIWERIQDTIRDGERFTAEFRVLLPDGSARWLSTWAHLHRTADGVASRMVGATISVDAYKKAEAALRESDRRKDDFLAMLAHELRNPLAPINTAAQLLRRYAGDAERVRDTSDIIARQVKHMTDLVDDLLDVSRVTRGLIKLKIEPQPLDAIIDAAVEQVQPLVRARGHTLQLAPAAGRLQVDADPTRLVQVLVNLLNNSIKYTPPGGLIRLTVERDAGQVRISVADNGAGIDAALLPQVFDLFTQAARTPDRSQGGLGIGLALVRSIAAMHGGEVSASSDGPGRGSTFVLTLPLSTEAAAPARPVAAQPPASATPLEILVVDDNVDAAESLAALLKLDGHGTRISHTAAQALADAAQLPADVYILDIGLPDMDGHALAKRLRQLEANGGALFIALTGYGQPQDHAESKAAGFDLHFVKPVDPGQLMRALSGVSTRA